VKTAAISDVAVVFIKNGFEVDERRVLEEELSLHLGKKVKVVEYTNDLKKLVEQLIYPATLYGINRVWIPDGSELLNIRVSKRDRKFLKNKEEYEKLIEKISNAKVKIIFE
jgi:transcription antitermination factor NusA-like protein